MRSESWGVDSRGERIQVSSGKQCSGESRAEEVLGVGSASQFIKLSGDLIRV